jgi:hypothetical protein
MAKRKYRLISPTLALFLEEGHQVAHTIPEGTIVTIDSETFDGDNFVNVTWKNKDVRMFTQDIRCRAKPLRGNSDSESAT